ncbi:hypothetical protein ZWY2020_054380 [Hordeum vulgare]|nr:hypothetical protein ZWY2020_054380 [Hordeum vulgare]
MYVSHVTWMIPQELEDIHILTGTDILQTLTKPFCSFPVTSDLGKLVTHRQRCQTTRTEAGSCEVRGTMKTSFASKFGTEASRPGYIAYPLQ